MGRRNCCSFTGRGKVANIRVWPRNRSLKLMVGAQNRQFNRKQSCTRLISIGQVIPTWQVGIASICSKLRSPGSCLSKVNTFMGQLLKSSTIIPESGIYRVIHSQHRLPHEVTLIGGQTFPPCGKCHEEVRFELVRELPELERERRGHVSLYSLPALDDEEG